MVWGEKMGRRVGEGGREDGEGEEGGMGGRSEEMG